MSLVQNCTMSRNYFPNGGQNGGYFEATADRRASRQKFYS